MARGRKSTVIKLMTFRDINLLKQLANTGICSIEQASTYCKLNRNRILKLEKSGFIKIEKVIPVGGEIIEVVRIKSKGKKYCEYNIGTQYFYKTNINQPNHDLKLTETYYQTIINYPTAIWKNETQVFYENKEIITNGDCVDAVVYVDGKCFAIEVIGRRYSQKTIDNKVANGNKIAGETILI